MHSRRSHTASTFVPISPLDGRGANVSGTGITATTHDLGLLYLAVDSLYKFQHPLAWTSFLVVQRTPTVPPTEKTAAFSWKTMR